MSLIEKLKLVYNRIKNSKLQLSENVMSKDIFNIYGQNGRIYQMQAITIYSIEKTGYNYIIYKELKKEKYYVAKFKGETTVELNTQLDKRETEYANTVLNKIITVWAKSPKVDFVHVNSLKFI